MNNKQKAIKAALGIFFLLAWVSGQVIRGPKVFPLTPLDVSVLLLICYCVIARSLRRGNLVSKSDRHDRARLGLAMTLASWVLSLRLFTLTEALPGLLYFFRVSAYVLVIIRAKDLFNPVMKWIPFTLWVFLLLGIAQYVFLPDTRFLLRYGWDEHYYRLIGTVLDPNYAGAMAGMVFIFGLTELNNRLRRRRPQVSLSLSLRARPSESNDPSMTEGLPAMTVLVILAFIGLVLTYSRASWLATFIGLLMYVVISRFNRFRISTVRRFSSGMTLKIVIGLLMAGFVLYLAPKPGGEGVNLLRTNSIAQRTESWQQGLAVWQSHPLLGVGFNNYRIASGKDGHTANSPDSSWILLLATTGVAGMLLVTIEIIRLIATSRSGARNDGLLISLFLLLGVHAMFNNTLFFPPVLALLAMIRAASSP